MRPALLISLFLFAACASSSPQGDSLTEVERQERFMELFEMELQNRAFAKLWAERSFGESTAEGDKTFLGAWVDWERFLKEKYAPYAKKYGLSQEPESGAKMQASLSLIAAGVLPDRKMMNLMLDQTISYVDELRELERVSPVEDQPFFAFVVQQEEAQVDSLRFRANGDHQRAANVLREFMAGASADSSR